MDADDRRALSAAVAAANDDWLHRYRNVPPRHPERLAVDADYGEHYLHLEATPDMEAEYQRLIEARGWRRVPGPAGVVEWVRSSRGAR